MKQFHLKLKSISNFFKDVEVQQPVDVETIEVCKENKRLMSLINELNDEIDELTATIKAISK